MFKHIVVINALKNCFYLCVFLPELNDTFSDNNDTVGQIVHFIMNNEGMCATPL